jgi:hypothetical protein
MVSQPNQLHRELLGVNGLDPFNGTTSASRKQMFGSHITQTLVVKGGTERLCQTGMEQEYGKYTFSVKVPGDPNKGDGIEVLAIIDRYPEKIGLESMTFKPDTNPQSIIIYEDIKTKEIGMIDIVRYCSYHQYFGFSYKKQNALSNVRVGAFLPAGDILLDSPSITENGGYKYGIEANVAYMSHPACSEDGILVSRDILHKFGYQTFEERVVEFGSKRMPLNLYGTIDNYKPFPDIGDRIREDGLLMCLRTYDKNLAPVEQSIYDLMEPDFIHDKLTYVSGPGGKIVDIKIQHDNQSTQAGTPPGMEPQLEKYDRARRQFYQEIITLVTRLRRERKERGGELQLTRPFHRLCVEARSVIEGDQQRIQKLFRQAPLDDWRVVFTIQYDVIPNIGNKFTDCFGGKGVVCHIAEPHEMPIDEDGNRADFIFDPNSTIARMNISRLYEQYFNAAGRDVVKKLAVELKYIPGEKGLENRLAAMEASSKEVIDKAWNYLIGFYGIISPKMYEWMTGGAYFERARRTDHLASILKNNMYKYLPPDNPPELIEMVKAIETHYRPTYGPVSYIGYSGNRVTTKKNVRIGSMYIIELEKTGDDWTAVSSGKLQHHGVLSQVTNSDKYSQPSRNQAIRALGESEVRIYISNAGPLVTADILDRNNNPASHKQILRNILAAEKPTDIPLAVDRNVVPLGGSRPLQLVKHILQCGGIRFTYSDHIPNWKPSNQRINYQYQQQ